MVNSHHWYRTDGSWSSLWKKNLFNRDVRPKTEQVLVSFPLTAIQSLFSGTYLAPERSVTYHFKSSNFCSCLNCYIQSNVHVIIKSCENLRSAQKYFPPLPITHQNMLYAFAALTNVFSTTGNVLAFPEYFKLLFPQCEILSHPKCNMWFLGCSSCNDRNGEARD